MREILLKHLKLLCFDRTSFTIALYRLSMLRLYTFVCVYNSMCAKFVPPAVENIFFFFNSRLSNVINLI